MVFPPGYSPGGTPEPAPTPSKEEHVSAAYSLVQFATEVADRLAAEWEEAVDASEQAILLDGHGRRMAALCRGVGLIPSRADMAATIGLIR